MLHGTVGDAALAAELAEKAGNILLELRARGELEHPSSSAGVDARGDGLAHSSCVN